MPANIYQRCECGMYINTMTRNHAVVRDENGNEYCLHLNPCLHRFESENKCEVLKIVMPERRGYRVAWERS